MIITRLAGGLGNQMFHYASARGYQRYKNEPIVLDNRLLTELENDIDKIIQRPYALNIFANLKASLLSETQARMLLGSDFFNKIRRKLFNLRTHYHIQDSMVPLTLDQKKTENVFLVGNFQSEEYFKNLKKDLIHEFEFPVLDHANKQVERQILATDNALSIHIRRGDYLSAANKSIFSSVNLNYYTNALDILRSKSEKMPEKIFVFTDDIKWVKENFNFESLNFVFIEGNYGENSWKDMYLMSCCTNHIIANSSFSWWGAWLKKNEGITIAPRHWYLPNSEFFDINHIVPDSWTIVDYDLE